MQYDSIFFYPSKFYEQSIKWISTEGFRLAPHNVIVRAKNPYIKAHTGYLNIPRIYVCLDSSRLTDNVRWKAYIQTLTELGH
jgi:hypothetical protein